MAGIFGENYSYLRLFFTKLKLKTKWKITEIIIT